MRTSIILLALTAPSVLAAEEPKSEAGTQFIERCLKDVSENRIANLKSRAPEYAASLSDEELLAGGMRTARKTCPCFLQIIAVDNTSSLETPEERVRDFVDYLGKIETEQAVSIPAALPKLTRLCGVSSAVLPSSWISQ